MERWSNIRKYLHKHPELSGDEQQTASYILKKLQRLKPNRIYTNIGGHGVAVCFDSNKSGPNILFRSELDALPIEELNDFEYRSIKKGISHKCGHDGHMAIILSLAKKIAETPPIIGSVTLLFQPAEETGQGANAVVNDAQFNHFKPDFCFALHNLPGYSEGEVLLRSGNFNCASRGVCIKLKGKTAHAAYPETGISPANMLAELMQTLPYIADDLKYDELIMLTLIHCSMGEEAFGTAPADGKLLATLRAESNAAMQALVDKVTTKVTLCAKQNNLALEITWFDIFNASVNNPECVKYIADAAATSCGHHITWLDKPFRWSEDFGAISSKTKGAMFAFGAGEQIPQLHNPDYDFPDQLIIQGRDIFFKIYQNLLCE